jgi:predicted permease
MSHPAPFDLTPDWRVLLYSLALALTAGAIAGLSPALESLRPALSESLKGSGGAVTAGPRRSKLRSGLVAVQIALSLVLLLQAGLFAKAHRHIFAHDPGFETKQVLSVTLASVLTGHTPHASFYSELEARVRPIPGVVEMAFVSHAPWAGRNSAPVSEIDGKPFQESREFRRGPARRMVTPGYFAALGLPVIRGRAFGPNDKPIPGQPVPVVVSEAMAQRYWPGQDPIGHRFRAGALYEIVGVSRDAQTVAFMTDDSAFYHGALDITITKPPYLLVRVSGSTEAAAVALRDAVRGIDPQMGSTIVTLGATVEEQAARLKPIMIYGSAAGALALLLALTGVYGIVSFSVSQRVREIGIRMALGAQRKDVLSLVLRSGAAPVCVGLAAGLGLALIVSTRLEPTLFGVSARDPFTLSLVPLLLLAAALVAVWIPARRAAALEPLASLRHD